MSWRKTNETVRIANDVSSSCHSRAGGNPKSRPVGPRLRGDDGKGWPDDAVREVPAARRARHDDGVALIMVLLAMLVMSALAATIVYTARAETFASTNYRLETEADYIAKAGIQRAANWFRSTHYAAIQQTQAAANYCVTSTGSPYNLYTSNNSPVVMPGLLGCSLSSSSVQLIGYGSGSSNFPAINNTDSPAIAVATAFKNDLVKISVTDANGNKLGTFSVRAIMMNYQTVGLGLEPPYTMVPVETWSITSLGTYTDPTGLTATAEEAATVQPIFVPTWGNALYGFCNVTMNGSAGTCTDAFNSAYGAFGDGSNKTASGYCTAATGNAINSGANVGANGSVSLGSSVTVGGNVVVADNPPSGCTPCTTTAPYYCGSSTSVSGQVITGPTKTAPPAPTFPTTPATFPGSAPSYNLNTNDVRVIPVGATWSNSPFPQNNFPNPVINPATSTPCMDTSCDGSAAHPYEIKSVSMNGGGNTCVSKGGNAPDLKLVGSNNPAAPIYYDIGSLAETNGCIDVSGYVVLNVQSGLSIGGNGVTNGVSSDIPPEYLEMNYAGTSDVTISGNGAVSAVLNAPNATVKLGGGGSGGYFVGAIQAGNVVVQGGYPVHYDLQLSRMGGTMGVITTTAYSRQKM